jgi:choline dehydrogenase-like flavoprotein
MAMAGFSVTCLEQGNWVRADEYASDKMERALLHETTWHPDPNHRKRPEDYPFEVSETPIHPVVFNAVGGSTIHYGALWTRLLPSDFRIRTLDGLADDWPISYWDLAPYYDKIDQLMGISGLAGNPTYPPTTPPPNPPLPLGEIGRRAAEGFNRLGWHWWPCSNAIASRPHRYLSACKRRGTCGTGCPEGAKASVDVAIWPEAIQHGAQVVTGARVRRITTNAQGLATGAEWVDRQGVVRHSAAGVVVVACNGAGSSRLLLLSDSGRHPEGLANSSGLVGRRLQMHSFAMVSGRYEEDLQSYLGPYGSPVESSEFAERETTRGFWGGGRATVLPVTGPVETWRHTGHLPLQRRIGPGLHEIASTTGHVFDISISMDDLPNEDNRVTLAETLTDGDGIPAPKITWTPMPDAGKALDFFAARFAEVHEAAGAIEVRRLKTGPSVGWHLLGTACMGSDRERSVVDSFGRAHDVPNLFVVDGSVFVTSGQTNPTATIMAFAQRAAEHLAGTARSQKTAV